MYDCEGEGRNIAGEITVYWSGLERDSDSPWSANQTRFRGQSSFFFSEFLNFWLLPVSQPASSRKKQKTNVFKSCFGGIWVARFSMDNPKSCC